MATKEVPITEKRKPPAAGKGRPKGSANKTTTKLKEAILIAAEQVGCDGAGKDGLTGYLRSIAKEDKKAYATLLGKVLPMQVTGEDGGPIQIAKVELVALSDDDNS